MNPETKKRELDAIIEAMNELSLDAATIITIDNDETIPTDMGSIYCISLWKWLLFWGSNKQYDNR
jgi:predicted AAA+ superfamily ATPase